MSVLRRFTVWALLSIFFSSLLFFAYGWVFNETFGRRETVKSWFEDSGAYANFVDEIVALSQAQAAEEGGVIDAKTLQDAAKNSFSPELLQTSLETMLDGSYDWLEGDEPEIYFSVDLTGAKTVFADNLTQFASSRVESLPICNETQLSSDAFDPFSAVCKPATLDFKPLAEDFRRLIIEDEAFLPDPVIDSTDITINKDGQKQSLAEAASYLPTGYTFARFIPLVAIVAATISGILVVGIANSKSKGVFKLFRGFAFTALSLGIFTFVTSQSTAWVDSVLAIDPAAQGFTERIVKPLIITATQDITAWTYRFTVIYGVIAVFILAVYLFIFKFNRKSSLPDLPPHETQHNKAHFAKVLAKDEKDTLEIEYRKRVAKGSKKYKKSHISKDHQPKKPQDL